MHAKYGYKTLLINNIKLLNKNGIIRRVFFARNMVLTHAS